MFSNFATRIKYFLIMQSESQIVAQMLLKYEKLKIEI